MTSITFYSTSPEIIGFNNKRITVEYLYNGLLQQSIWSNIDLQNKLIRPTNTPSAVLSLTDNFANGNDIIIDGIPLESSHHFFNAMPSSNCM